jgi:hypothetical protein
MELPHTGARLLQLRQSTDTTFTITSGTPEMLVEHLEARNYLRTSLKDSNTELHRLEGALRAERALVRILCSGTVMVQGTPRGIGATLLLLQLLVIHPTPEPAAVQEMLPW